VVPRGSSSARFAGVSVRPPVAAANEADESDPFFVACERLRRMCSGHDTLDARFAIGRLVASVMADPQTYGTGAVVRMAAQLGRHIGGLYQYARVTECWTRADAQRLLDPQPEGEWPLTWSHLVALASLDDRHERARWTRLTRLESLSVRDLGRRLAGRQERGGSERRLERAIRAVEQFLADCEQEPVAAWALVQSSETLDRAVVVHERLQAMAAGRVAALRKARAALNATCHFRRLQ
jgi:hypothetical protein